MKKKRPPTLKQLIRKERGQTARSLAAWSAIVRAKGCCDVCGSTVHVKTGPGGELIRSKKTGRVLSTKLDAHHVLPKERYNDLKYERLNGVCLCPRHHKHGKYSAHRNPFWFVLWLRKHAPEKYEWAKRNVGAEGV